MPAEEVTGVQTISIALSGEELNNPLPKSFATYRTIRTHPTVAMARALRTAPVLSSNWAVSADDDVDEDIVDWVEKTFFPFRNDYLESALTFGNVDYGWQGYEIVWTVGKEGRVILHRLKPLLVDLTEILIDKTTGEFSGFFQSRDNVRLEREKSLLVSFQVEGTGFYGESLLENIRLRYNEWIEANEGAARYDKKMAGSIWKVGYPVGSSRVDGAETDNATTAETILQNIKAGGSVSFPTTKREVGSEVNAWDIDLVGGGSTAQTQFIQRLEYLDKLMVRGLIMPERAIIEGKFGTKADAGEHANLALTNMELLHAKTTLIFNNAIVKPALTANFGEDVADAVDIIAMPILDRKREFFANLYNVILSNPAALLEELGSIDTEALKDALEIPKRDSETPSFEERAADILKIKSLMDERAAAGDLNGNKPGA